MDKLACLGLGWFLGCLVMTIHYHASGLIRSRSEWYRYRKLKGYTVPE
jgi:hypothetical protein